MKAIDFLSLMTLDTLPLVNCMMIHSYNMPTMMIHSCNMPTTWFDGFVHNKIKKGSLQPGHNYFVLLYIKPLKLNFLTAPDAVLSHSDPRLEICAWEIE